jgi:hypothetical protein
MKADWQWFVAYVLYTIHSPAQLLGLFKVVPREKINKIIGMSEVFSLHLQLKEPSDSTSL